MKILHHSDLDGLCAAAIVLTKHPDAECIEVDYGLPVPWERIDPDEEVVIVDFSLQKPGDWERLYELTHDIVWIDHHETAINKAKDVVLESPLGKDHPHDGDYKVFHLSGLRDVTACGAMLTWRYFQGGEAPPVLDLVDRWDRWVHNDDPHVIDFGNGSEIYHLHPKSELWTTTLRGGVLADATIREIQIAGQHIGKFRAMEDAKAVRRFAFEVAWEGYRCIVLFTDRAGSKIFDSVKGQYDILMPVNFDGKKYTVHMYSDTVKVNDIAARHGGGGHPGSAGFVCERLPWSQRNHWVGAISSMLPSDPMVGGR